MSFTPSTRRLFQSTSTSLARRPNRRDASGDGLDMSNIGEFSFPLTRPAILKQEQRRQFLHYLRLEQFQLTQLGKPRLSPRPLSQSRHSSFAPVFSRIQPMLTATPFRSKLPPTVPKAPHHLLHQSPTPALSGRAPPRLSQGGHLVPARRHPALLPPGSPQVCAAGRAEAQHCNGGGEDCVREVPDGADE